jgi:hypothetical protein
VSARPGGEAIADVDWTVKTAGRADGVQEYRRIPVYRARRRATTWFWRKRGEQVPYTREFQVQPGGGEEVEVLTTVGAPN